MEETLPPVVSSVGHSTSLNENSDSGDSLFITQHPKVPKAKLRKKLRKSQSTSSRRGDGSELDIRASIGTTGNDQSAAKRKKVKLPPFNFPFVQNRSKRVGLTYYTNAKLHHALMGGFLINVRDHQSRIDEDLQTSLPTIDEDGVCLAPISEDEDDDFNEEPIRVVKNNCFVVSTKTKRIKQWQSSQGEVSPAEEQRRHKSEEHRFKARCKGVQGEAPMATVMNKTDIDTLRPKCEATVCEPTTEEFPNNSRTKSTAAGASGAPEILSQTGDHGGQKLSEDGSNMDTDYHESGIKEKKKKKRKKNHKSREASEEANPEHEGEETQNSPINDTVKTKNIHTSLQAFSKKKNKKKIRLEIVEVKPIHEEEECSDKPHKPAEGADDTDLKTKKRKKKNALTSKSVHCETVARVEDSDSATPSFPFADAKEKTLSCTSDPTSAEIRERLDEDIVLRKRKKKKKKMKAADDDEEEKNLSPSGSEIEVRRKKKRKRENMIISKNRQCC